MVRLCGARLFVYTSQHLGPVEVRKFADLVVIHNDPLEDLHQSTSTSYVMVNGRLYDAMTMNEIGHSPRERSRFYGERPEVDDGLVWWD